MVSFIRELKWNLSKDFSVFRTFQSSDLPDLTDRHQTRCSLWRGSKQHQPLNKGLPLNFSDCYSCHHVANQHPALELYVI